MNRKALGKGLGALIPDVPGLQTVESKSPRMVSLDKIRPNPYQPRTVFEPEALKELAESIRQNGLIQPLIVRADGTGKFELIAGERRFMACRQAGLLEIPVVLREASRREMLEVAMVENLQREDLNPIEEATAYKRMASEFDLSQEEIARRVGKNRSTVTNTMRLLGLPEQIRNLVSRGTLSSGHARALLSLPGDPARLKLASEIARKGLSVRQTEARVQGQGKPRSRPKKRSHPALGAWEERLRNRYGTQVKIVGGTGRGRVEIHYFSEDDLERIMELSGADTQL